MGINVSTVKFIFIQLHVEVFSALCQFTQYDSLEGDYFGALTSHGKNIDVYFLHFYLCMDEKNLYKYGLWHWYYGVILNMYLFVNI